MKPKTKIIIGAVLLIGIVAGVVIYLKKKKIADAFAPLEKTIIPGSKVTPTSSSLLKKGSSGAAVKDLNSKLFKLGYNVGMFDDTFTASTEAAVKEFQKSKKLTSDGIAGPLTLTALNNATK